jgi:hypothetical protein
MKFNCYILLTVLVSIILQSCAIEKRQHLSGYYINRMQAEHKKADAGLVKESNTILEKEISDITEELSASNLNEPIFLEKYVNVSAKEAFNQKRIQKQECDVILLTDGEEVKAKVMEITLTSILFKRCDNLKGPMMSIDLPFVFMITYANGTKELFKDNLLPKSAAPEKIQDRGKSNSLATISFLFTCLSLVFFPLSLIGLITGLIALSQFRKKPGLYKNKWMAIVGVVAGIVNLIFIFFLFYLFILLL